MELQLIWFKRDLRVLDHEPLVRAMRAGPTVALYVYEPGYWALPEHSPIHFDFVAQSVEELRRDLAALGVPLLRRTGEAAPVLERMHHELGFAHIWSHEETGLDWTRRRDARVAHVLAELEVRWTELPQFGVLRPSPG
ncbi:MAG: deoxyribodipyrimidine photo-lyase, partial [Myxococcota bacterium]